MTITATPEPGNAPPRVGIALALPANSVMQQVELTRKQGSARELVRSQPAAGFDQRTVFDYEAPYEVPISYEWTTEYLDGNAFTTQLTETWANLAAWDVTNGAGGAWSVSGGTLIYTGPASGVAKIVYTLASGRYRITFAARPLGIDRVNFGGFYIDVLNSRLVVAGESLNFDTGTGTWVINVTPTSVTLTTTAGTYSIPAGVNVTKIEYLGPRIRTTITSPLSMTQGGFSFTPTEAATDTTGRLFILGVRYSGPTAFYRVLVFSAAGAYLTGIDLVTGVGNGQFTAAVLGMAIDGSNRLILGDYMGARIQRFTIGGAGAGTTLTYLDKVGTVGAGNGQFQNGDIGAITTDNAGNVYVVQTNSHKVQKFTSALAYSTQWGSYGPGDSQFYTPLSIASDGVNIYVADRGYPGNNTLGRLRKFSGTGVFTWKATVMPDFSDAPGALAVDSNGQVYLATGKREIDVFTSGGGRVMTIPQPNAGGAEIRALAMNPARTALWAAERGDYYSADLITLGGAIIDDVQVETYGGIKRLTESSAVVTLSPADAWLIHPANPVLSVALSYDNFDMATVESIGAVTQRTTATTHQILGTKKPIHVNTGPRQSDELALVIASETVGTRKAIAGLVADETPILIRVPPSWALDFDDDFYAVGDVSYDRALQMYGVPARVISLPLQAVEAPEIGVQSTGWSWAALAAEFPTWTAVRAAFATWADVLINKRRAGF